MRESMSIGKELLDRLICAKYIFLRGVEVLDRGGSFSSGLAVLHFQDAVEMALRVIAEYLHCSLKENAAFNQIIDAIDGVGDRKLTHRSALNQLNKARLNFKHFGLEPKEADAKKFKLNIEDFFPFAVQSFLDIDFESISLTNLIGHRRTEKFLNEAERLINKEDYEGAIRSTTIAFTIFRAHCKSYTDKFQRDTFHKFKDQGLQRWADNIEDILAQQQSQLDLIFHGINLADYRRFQRFTPTVHLSDAGTYSVINFSSGELPTRDFVLFCHRFVIEAILLIKKNQLPSRFPFHKPSRKLRVIKKCDIIVWPCNDPEIIRQAEVGEILLGRLGKFDKSGYNAILQDDDEAYVSSDAVEPLGLEINPDNKN